MTEAEEIAWAEKVALNNQINEFMGGLVEQHPVLFIIGFLIATGLFLWILWILWCFPFRMQEKLHAILANPNATDFEKVFYFLPWLFFALIVVVLQVVGTIALIRTAQDFWNRGNRK